MATRMRLQAKLQGRITRSCPRASETLAARPCPRGYCRMLGHGLPCSLWTARASCAIDHCRAYERVWQLGHVSHSLLESRECDSPCHVLRGVPIASDEPVTAQLAGYRPRWSPVGMLARARCAHRGTYVAPGRPLRGLGSSDHVLCVFARIFVIISMLAISAELSKFLGKILSTPILAEKGGRANPCCGPGRR